MHTKIRSLLLPSVLVLAATHIALSQDVDHTIKIVSDDWSSLEIVKLVIELLTPAAMLYIGLWFDRRIKEFEHRQWSNQKVIEKRLEVYEKLTPKLNDLMCYFLRIGSWKELCPADVIDIKRDIDKDAYIYAPLFSPEFLERYNDFISVCFATFRGAGKDAALRAEASFYREAYVGEEGECAQWQESWNDCFVEASEASPREDVSQRYRELVGLIASEIGVGELNAPTKAEFTGGKKGST